MAPSASRKVARDTRVGSRAPGRGRLGICFVGLLGGSSIRTQLAGQSLERLGDVCERLLNRREVASRPRRPKRPGSLASASLSGRPTRRSVQRLSRKITTLAAVVARHSRAPSLAEFRDERTGRVGACKEGWQAGAMVRVDVVVRDDGPHSESCGVQLISFHHPPALRITAVKEGHKCEHTAQCSADAGVGLYSGSGLLGARRDDDGLAASSPGLLRQLWHRGARRARRVQPGMLLRLIAALYSRCNRVLRCRYSTELVPGNSGPYCHVLCAPPPHSRVRHLFFEFQFAGAVAPSSVAAANSTRFLQAHI